jgi:hypothetical protein
MEQNRIQAISRVNLQAPPGREERLRWFYGELAELEEVANDRGGASRLCFKSGRIEIHIHMMKDPRIDPIGNRATIAVPSLSDCVEQLEESSTPYERLTGTMFTDRRVQTHDPAGNRVTLKQYWPVGLF